jgi:arsenite oxidase large subunit
MKGRARSAGITAGVDSRRVLAGVQLILPNYKQTWADIRKITDASPATRKQSFKSWEVEL